MSVLEVAALAAREGARGEVKIAEALMRIIALDLQPVNRGTGPHNKLPWAWCPQSPPYMMLAKSSPPKPWFDRLQQDSAAPGLVRRYYRTEARAYLALARAMVQAEDWMERR